MTDNATHGIPGPGESWEGRTPTPEQLAEVLRLHGMWLRGEEGGVRANLNRANLRRANLSGTDLSGADLLGANLRLANLNRANLSRADLRYADLFGADLRGADLREADLCEANLCEADLRDADMSAADLRDADLSRADMSGAKLRAADLRDADLSDADLRNANLLGAILSGAQLPDGRTYEQWRADPLAGLCDDPESTQRAIEAWGGRTWEDCPMHAAHGWNSLYDAPQNKRSLAATFIALLDGGHLPRPEGQS